jgi:excisionase family DNA binding protein
VPTSATVALVNATEVKWLNTAKAAERLGVTPRTLYRFIDEGQVPAYRFGRVIRLKEHEVDDFIERCRIAPGALDLTTSEPTHDLRDSAEQSPSGTIGAD